MVVSLFIIIGVVALSWIPIFWPNSIKIDKPKFAISYYKTLVDIGKILFGFWLANILLKSVRENQLINHYQNEWENVTKILHKSITDLLKVSEVMSKKYVDDLEENIRNSHVKLDYLADIVSVRLSNYDIGDFGSFVYKYKNEMKKHVQKILMSFDNGEILPLKHLDKDVENSIYELLDLINK